MILRFDGAADRWDTLRIPAIRAAQLNVATGRLVLLDVHPDNAPTAPGGALLDTEGIWHLLPALPSSKHGSEHAAWNAATWINGQLILTSHPLDKQIYVAALNLDNLKKGWEARPAVDSTHRRPNNRPPVAVGGRIVWPMVVYDPATGRSTPTPALIRDKLQRQDGGDDSGYVPSLLALGDQVTLASYAFDPVTGKSTPIPNIPPYSTGGGSAGTGGPRGILGFGGTVSAAGVATTTTSALRLLSAS